MHFGAAAPGLGALGALLQKMHAMLATELQARGAPKSEPGQEMACRPGAGCRVFSPIRRAAL